MNASHRLRARMTRQRGFSLMEVMIAMVILCIVLTLLAGLALALSRRSIRNAGKAYETGLLTKEIDRAVAVPIESLAVKLGTTTIDTPTLKPWPFRRTITTTGRADSLTVKIVIRPLNSTQSPDSLVQSVLRTR